MDDITVSVSKRVINPQKIAVKQFEANTKILKFRLDDYKIDQVDLRNYKAYAVTSIKGFVDTVELAMDSDATGITLVWSLGERTLRYAGVITYQIVFKENAEDTTSVYNTYEAIIQCSESIDADHQISADCPTVLQQHFYLMQTLSGYFGSDITYMPVDEPIPLEERLDNRIYYQWLEKPTVRAKCATGTVNLGERPYADCGLYINNVHIYVDNTSENAFAIDSEAWVDAINNANCGVTAVNIDGGDNVVFKLSAKNVGSYGNSIPIKFDVAQYGELSGKTYSDGKLSGSYLSGGIDAETGLNQPSGRFEDAHGNILGNSRAQYLTDADLNTVLDNGEYLCVGTLLNAPIDCTYCMVRVTDTLLTDRVIQEVYVPADDNTVRVFARAITGYDGFGEWSELAKKGNVEGDMVIVSDANGNLTSHVNVSSQELNALDGYNVESGSVESRMVNLERGLTGEIKWFAGTSVPAGYLLCNGSPVSRTTYSRLFATIGTTWGKGNGTSTFNLPNLIDRVAWGASKAGTYKAAGLPDHKHDVGFAHYQVGAYGEKAISTSKPQSGYGSAPFTATSSYTSNASTSDSIYGNSNTVQPPAATLIPIIRY